MGDGTTTVVILAGEFLKECKPFVEEGVHPQVIIRAFRQAGQLAVAQVKALAVSIAGKDEEETKDLLRKCASTAMNSKLVRMSQCRHGPLCQWQSAHARQLQAAKSQPPPATTQE